MKNALKTKPALTAIIALALAFQVVHPTATLAADAPFEPGSQAAQALNVEVQAASEAIQAPETVQDVLLDVCHQHGYADTLAENCAKHLLGICWKESHCKADAKGDYVASVKKYMAYGWFQINRYYNPDVSIEEASDLRWSANWTLNYLERHSYPKYVKYAIQCHNGCGFDNGYADTVLRSSRTMWDQPIALTQPDFKMALANN